MRLVVFSDGPSVPTGFGVVVRNIFASLFASGRLTSDDVAFFAINYGGDWTPDSGQFRMWPAKVGLGNDPDPYGRQRFMQMMLGGAWPCDVLFLVQDHFTVAPFLPQLVQEMRKQVAAGQRPPFRVVQYIPIDGHTLRPEWVSWIPDVVDYPVAYMHWAAERLLSMVPALRDRLSVIYHGTNPDAFRPLPEVERQAFRQQALGVAPTQPLVTWVNRNQPRKDPAAALQIFRRVLNRYPTAVMYLHCNIADAMGFNLELVRQELRIPATSVRFPQNFSEGVGVSVEVLNRVYGAGDLFLTTAKGEGFGLTVPENMCTGTPCLAPRHSAFAEILADGRGLLVDPLPHGSILPFDNDQLRPLPNIDAMADAACWAIEHRDEARAIGQRGMDWARQIPWSAIASEWWRVFTAAEASLRPMAPAPSPAPYALRAEAIPA